LGKIVLGKIERCEMAQIADTTLKVVSRPTVSTLDSRVRDALLAGNGTQVTYSSNANVFHQGDPAEWVHYVVAGKAQVSVTSKQGKQGVIAVPLVPGDFIGEIGLTNQPFYLTSADATCPSQIVRISRENMRNAMRANSHVADAFTAFVLQHSADIEAELIDHLFNSSEKRLARTLLLLANFAEGGQLQPIEGMTQELLAKRVGTTRGRISFFMNKFRRLGLIDYNGTIIVRGGLLSVVLHDSRLKDE
jgi:CRP-like cAMP-binding protein